MITNSKMFDERKQSASLPDIGARTITIGRAGKTFSVTGWKLSWGIEPSNLIQPLCVLQHNSIYRCPRHIQTDETFQAAGNIFKEWKSELDQH